MLVMYLTQPEPYVFVSDVSHLDRLLDMSHFDRLLDIDVSHLDRLLDISDLPSTSELSNLAAASVQRCDVTHIAKHIVFVADAILNITLIQCNPR